MGIRDDYKLGVWYDSCPFLFSYGLKEKQAMSIPNKPTYLKAKKFSVEIYKRRNNETLAFLF